MTTGFSIQPGYPYSEANKCTIKEIYAVAKTIGSARVKAKCAEYGLTKIDCSEDCTLDEFLSGYDNLDSNMYGSMSHGQYHQSAGSATGHRGEVEIIRRAFFMLLLDECFRRKWAVSFTIA